ncbi:hypothetical protein M514_00259, partial [Trichuris suis]
MSCKILSNSSSLGLNCLLHINSQRCSGSVLCLGPHRLDGLRVRPSGQLHEVQRMVDTHVLELMFSKAPVLPPPVCYDGSPRPHMTLYNGEQGGGRAIFCEFDK